MSRRPSLRDLRMRLRVMPMTQVELARRVGCSVQTLNYAERGTRTIGPKWEARLARVLGVGVEDLRDALLESRHRALTE